VGEGVRKAASASAHHPIVSKAIPNRAPAATSDRYTFKSRAVSSATNIRGPDPPDPRPEDRTREDLGGESRGRRRGEQQCVVPSGTSSKREHRVPEREHPDEGGVRQAPLQEAGEHRSLILPLRAARMIHVSADPVASASTISRIGEQALAAGRGDERDGRHDQIAGGEAAPARGRDLDE
jgi:hypothetical protein